MTEARSDEGKSDSKAERDAKKLAKQAAEFEERKKLMGQRTTQLEEARIALKKIQKALKVTHETAQRRKALSSHAFGIYEEVNKLAKGKTLNEVTSLLVEQANGIIRDAKAIVKDDIYLDRIKEFIPAGTNPVYPDVLVVVRVVRGSLDRCERELDTQKTRLQETLKRARTTVGALECFMSGVENCEYALKSDVRAYVEGQIDDSCFYYDDKSQVHLFD
jgi:hypothetical protein